MGTTREKIAAAAASKAAVAAAIEAKGGTVPERFADFGAAVEALPSGGDKPQVEKSSVNFRDFDGTLVHAMTITEARKLTALPDLPTRDGLVYTGWNHTLAELQSTLRPLEVGAVCHTTDGATKFYIEIPEGDTLEQQVFFEYDGKSATIDWGDGSEPETDVGGDSMDYEKVCAFSHQYHPTSFPAKYVISLTINEGTALSLGGLSGWEDTYRYHVFGEYDVANKPLYKRLVKLESGDCLTSIIAGGLRDCSNLKSIALSEKLTKLGIEPFCYDDALTCVVIPRSLPNLPEKAFNDVRGLRVVSLPGNLASVGLHAFWGAGPIDMLWFADNVQFPNMTMLFQSSGIRYLHLPANLTSMGNEMCLYMRNLEHVDLPAKLVEVPKQAFVGCDTLAEITFPEGLKKIGEDAFYTAKAMQVMRFPSSLEQLDDNSISTCNFENGETVLDFRAARQIPLNPESALSPTGVKKIIVPDSLYDAWKAHDDWKGVYYLFVKASEA